MGFWGSCTPSGPTPRGFGRVPSPPRPAEIHLLTEPNQEGAEPGVAGGRGAVSGGPACCHSGEPRPCIPPPHALEGPLTMTRTDKALQWEQGAGPEPTALSPAGPCLGVRARTPAFRRCQSTEALASGSFPSPHPHRQERAQEGAAGPRPLQLPTFPTPRRSCLGSQGARSRPRHPPPSPRLRWRLIWETARGRKYKMDREAGAAGPGPGHQLPGRGWPGVKEPREAEEEEIWGSRAEGGRERSLRVSQMMPAGPRDPIKWGFAWGRQA